MDDALTEYDCEQIALAARVGRDLNAPVRVRHSFFVHGEFPTRTVLALRSMAIHDIVVDEEVTGDANWHVAAFTGLWLTAEAIRTATRQMEMIAAHTEVTYNGWAVALTASEDTNLHNRQRPIS